MAVLIYGYIYKKKTRMKIVLQIAIMILLTSTQIHSQCSHPDYAGLMELYYSTGGPNWTNNTGWKEGAAGTNCNPCSGWKGVTCKNNRVTSINLSSNNLIGVIPNVSLPLLEGLFLTNNKLSGIIPNFTYFSNLRIFFCNNNQLSGFIPDFTNLPNLQTFFCSNNQLGGQIPNFSNLPNLFGLFCNNNQLSGSIPNFNNTPNLFYLYCFKNQLSGVIPNFDNLPSLNDFNCSHNLLNGSIPNFSDLQNLQTFDCSFNQLTGAIPDLKVLYFYCNNNLLTELNYKFKFSQLKVFTCENNFLTGFIPPLDNLISPRILVFKNNNFKGPLPILPDPKLINNAVIFDFSMNDFSGCIPYRYCEIEMIGDTTYISQDSIILYGSIFLTGNPKLPFKGDIHKFCANGGISNGAPCDDGLATTIEDHILPDCSCLGAIADTCLVTIYDTLIVRDTIIQFVTDTTFITITKEVAVTDTLIINLNLMNSTNQPVVNTVLVYPNPASSHIYVDTGDPALLENYDMQILNALGQPVYFTTIDQKIYYIDLNGWSGKGTYFLRIKNPAGVTIQTKKIILQ
jgi:hypothetical protein